MTADQKNTSEDHIKKLFNEHYRSLVQYSNRFLSIDECEDLVQDVFINLWEKETTFQDELHLKLYLYKAVRHKCYNIIKHNLVKNKYVSSTIQALEDDDLFLKHILEEDIVSQLYTAIEHLPDRKKEIIKLSLKGLKNSEIAEVLGIQLQTVKTLKSQSYKLLRDQFQDLESIIYFLLF
ncbi:RNA polymerase sigma factor [Flavobacterium succinicans]|uniref:RNA polymerase sigma factor FliA n=1 Tax=Flavobacterium succinicans TaxID=29536 RepID=A0A199XT14_9FLAO|nr:sigma-70 family RNA polymerase sigma factor [Flavobacterium succinicans]OAZ04562.1 RNA polymerase sigma factor FliA [Flavobacterium succinicans]